MSRLVVVALAVLVVGCSAGADLPAPTEDPNPPTPNAPAETPPETPPLPSAIVKLFLAPATSSTPDEPVTYTVDVASGLSHVMPTGQVTVTIAGGNETCTGDLKATQTDSLASGGCTVRFTQTGDDREVHITYSGNSQLASTALTFVHDVSTTNRPPEATFLPDPVHIMPSEPVTLQLPATDPDGDPLTFTLVRAPSVGTLDLRTDGSFTYTPNGDMQFDSFEFRASDGKSLSNVAVFELESVIGSGDNSRRP